MTDRIFDNIVFDLGGVVIDLDRERCVESFRRLGFADIDADLDKYVQSGIFFELETGKISPATFFEACAAKCRPGTTPVEIEDAFNRFLVSLPPERLAALRELRKEKKVFALSNTNPLMYNTWIAAAFRQEGLAINDYFDGIVASFQERVCKPDPKIFHILLRRYALDPEKTLFLDDSEANCEAARGCRMAAERIAGENDMIAVIRRLQNEREE